MRTREEIEKEFSYSGRNNIRGEELQRLTLELLLDIRDLLEKGKK